MVKALFRLLFRLNGWKLQNQNPDMAKNCIMVAAPHTTNWDFPFTMAALDLLGIDARFTIKKEFNRFPLGGLIASMGALWIDRSPKTGQTERTSMTDVMAELFEARKGMPMAMVVTPEGTRKKNVQWRTGFYYAALKSQVPICLAYMDYGKKECGVGLCFMPSGDLSADMRLIMDFYKDKQGKFPDKFALDERYTG